ncbi:hypothetical protein BGZ82_011307 [Podila clonocystis]|nr:hypothetical protein BGZ82_011307 [Podila clonocystis]
MRYAVSCKDEPCSCNILAYIHQLLANLKIKIQHSEGLDAWIVENRPEVCADTIDGRNGGDDKSGPRQVLFQLRVFSLVTGRYSTEHGATFLFLRRCRRFQRLRLPRFNSEDTYMDITGQMDLWLDLEHLDIVNFEPSRRWGDDIDAELLVACATP